MTAIKTAKTPKARAAKKTDEPHIVQVLLPEGCKKTNLSVDALDRFTREQAAATFVQCGGKPLLCRSIKLVEQGGEDCLQITLRPGSYSFDTAAIT